MQKNLIVGYFKNKVEGYKKQDKVAGREIDEENFIDEQWCLNHFHGCCAHCGVKFYIEMKAVSYQQTSLHGVWITQYHITYIMLNLGVSTLIVVLTDYCC